MPAISNAVAEIVNEEMRKWDMPDVALGSRVFWYPKAESDMDRGTIGLVTDVTKDYVELVLFGRKQHLRILKQVRHMTDPRLKLGEDFLASGVWDYIPPTHADKTTQGRLRSLEQKLARTEDAISDRTREITALRQEMERLQTAAAEELATAKKLFADELMAVKKAIAAKAQ